MFAKQWIPGAKNLGVVCGFVLGLLASVGAGPPCDKTCALNMGSIACFSQADCLCDWIYYGSTRTCFADAGREGDFICDTQEVCI